MTNKDILEKVLKHLESTDEPCNYFEIDEYEKYKENEEWS